MTCSILAERGSKALLEDLQLNKIKLVIATLFFSMWCFVNFAYAGPIVTPPGQLAGVMPNSDDDWDDFHVEWTVPGPEDGSYKDARMIINNGTGAVGTVSGHGQVGSTFFVDFSWDTVQEGGIGNGVSFLINMQDPTTIYTNARAWYTKDGKRVSDIYKVSAPSTLLLISTSLLLIGLIKKMAVRGNL